MLSTATVNRSDNLDYDIQELIKEEWHYVKCGCPNLIRDEGYSVEKEDDLDKLPF